MSNIIIGWDREALGQPGGTRFECPVETPDDGEHATCQWYVEVGPMRMTDIRIVRTGHSVTYSAPDDFGRVESIVESHLDLCHPGKKEELLAQAGRTLEEYEGFRQRYLTGVGALAKQQIEEALRQPGDMLDATSAELLQRTTDAVNKGLREQAAGPTFDRDRFGDRLSPAEQLSRSAVKCCGYPRICGDACID